LKADERIDPKAARTLALIFEVAYEQLVTE
jgi:hypothetical protein